MYGLSDLILAEPDEHKHDEMKSFRDGQLFISDTLFPNQVSDTREQWALHEIGHLCELGEDELWRIKLPKGWGFEFHNVLPRSALGKTTQGVDREARVLAHQLNLSNILGFHFDMLSEIYLVEELMEWSRFYSEEQYTSMVLSLAKDFDTLACLDRNLEYIR